MKSLWTIICILSLSLTGQAANLITKDGKTKKVASCNLYTPTGDDYLVLRDKGYNLIQTRSIGLVMKDGFVDHSILTVIDYSRLNLKAGDLYLHFGGIVNVNFVGWVQPNTNVKLVEVSVIGPVVLDSSKKKTKLALPWTEMFNLEDLPNCQE